MVQRSIPSLFAVIEVFFQEPTKIHFIKEISREIKLAHTSVRNIIKYLEKNHIIVKKKSKPFDGYTADRENEDFIFYKKAYNIYSLKDITREIVNSVYPSAIVLFGSYSRGEDVESSDIDIFVLSKAKKEINVSPFEKSLKRKINIMTLDRIEKLDELIRKKINNGTVLHGEI
ncbi:MAG: nucleotidyltransferase domain-containing protein [Nanoarchaeota archaeon]